MRETLGRKPNNENTWKFKIRSVGRNTVKSEVDTGDYTGPWRQKTRKTKKETKKARNICNILLQIKTKVTQ